MENNDINDTVELTEAENEQYDRQIRLWGLESQKRLRTAKVLISGLDGVGAEVTKNIILAGVNSVQLNDDQIVTELEYCNQFLIPHSALGKNRAEASIERARALNPMVDISADTEPLSKKDASYFKQFDVVVILSVSNKEILRVNQLCREYSIPFFAGDMWGMFGFYFADLQRHIFVEDAVKHKVISKPGEKMKTEMVTTTVQRELEFAPYTAVLEFDINSEDYAKKKKRNGPGLTVLKIFHMFREMHNRNPCHKTRDPDIEALKTLRDSITNDSVVPDSYFANVFGQISPSVAVLGGVLAHEVIKAITKREAPHNNLFIFDPERSCGFVEKFSVANGE